MGRGYYPILEVVGGLALLTTGNYQQASNYENLLTPAQLTDASKLGQGRRLEYSRRSIGGQGSFWNRDFLQEANGLAILLSDTDARDRRVDDLAPNIVVGATVTFSVASETVDDPLVLRGVVSTPLIPWDTSPTAYNAMRGFDVASLTLVSNPDNISTLANKHNVYEHNSAHRLYPSTVPAVQHMVRG